MNKDPVFFFFFPLGDDVDLNTVVAQATFLMLGVSQTPVLQASWNVANPSQPPCSKGVSKVK